MKCVLSNSRLKSSVADPAAMLRNETGNAFFTVTVEYPLGLANASVEQLGRLAARQRLLIQSLDHIQRLELFVAHR